MDEWHGVPASGGTEQPVAVPGRPAAFAGESAVRYTTAVADPLALDEEAATLVLDGTYARAEVEVTGERLGGEGAVTSDAYFAPVRVPFQPGDRAEIAVTCRAPEDRFGGIHDTDRVPEEAAVPGIWWDARLETHPLPAVVDLRVWPVVAGDRAHLHVRTTVVTGGPLEERLTYSLKPEGDLSTRGTMDRGSVVADGPGVTTVEHTVEVRDPALWWPRSLGEQHRYTLTAKLGDSERTVTTGIREVAREGGRLRVNGEALPIRGLTLLTDDPADVERALETNATLVRGHAHVLPPAVYEACDEAGLLVWQDLPLTGSGPFDVDRARDLVGLLAGRYRTHPSLAAVGIHDEPVDAFADSLGSGLLDRWRLRWRAWRSSYDRTAAEAVADAVPDEVVAIPVTAGPGVDHDAAAYYPGRDYGEPEDIDGLLDRYPADLLGAFGAPAPGGTGGADAADVGTTDRRARADGGGDPSQPSQATVLETVTRRARLRRVGTVAAALRDPADGGMGVYTTGGEPKEGQAALAAAFEPVQVLLADPASADPEVVVCNDRPTALSTTLSWAAGDERGEMAVEADPMGRFREPMSPPAGEDVTFELPVDGRTVTSRYER